jgi:phage tail-like protein
MALMGALGVRADPLLAHNFVISLLDTSSDLALAKSLALSAVFDTLAGGFSECTGLEMSLEVKDYEEGGRNGGLLRFPGRVKWSNLTLKKGVGAGQDLWDWHYGFVEGHGRRRDGVVMLLNELHAPMHIWYFWRGLPVKYSGPALSAAQNNVAIESVEIAHEGLYHVPYAGAGGAGATALASLG